MVHISGNPRIESIPERLKEALSKLELPSPFTRLEVTLDVDAAGQNALWVWLFLPETADSKEYLPAARDMRQQIRDIAREVTPDHWAYVELTTESPASLQE